MVWVVFYLIFNIIMTSTAQSIYGIQVVGFQIYTDAMLSVLMMYWARIDLSMLLKISPNYSFIFLLTYWMVAVLMWLSVYKTI